MSRQTLSERIADFALGLKYEDIPTEVLDHVKLMMIDTLGCVFASSREDHVDRVRRAVQKLPNVPEATLWGSDEKVTLDHAAMFNGCLIHGLDYDDTHAGAIIHPSASVLNAAFIMGERYGKSGREILTAMTAAYEVLLRLGEACKGKLHEHYFHPTGIFAPFAAIIISCRFQGLDKEVMVNAMGLAANFVGMMQQYTVDGTWSKKLHPGWGVHAGLYGLRFAQEGYVASREIFEGSQGLYMAHIGTTEFLEEEFSDMGSRWITKGVAFKFYPVCHMMHSHLDILSSLMEEHRFTAEDIASMHAILSPRAAEIVALPETNKKNPDNDYLMRFSIQYNLAMSALHNGLAPSDINMKWLDEPKVREMLDRITVESSPAAEVVGHFPGSLTVRLKDGREWCRDQKYEVGSKENPAKAENVLKKYYSNVKGATTEEAADRIIELINCFEDLDSVMPVIDLLKF